MKKKYTYSQWLNGTVALRSSAFIPVGKSLKIVSWEDFSEADVNRIKQKQQSVFEDAVTELLDNFKLKFEQKFEKALDKDTLLMTEVSECGELFRIPVPPDSYVHVGLWDLIFESKNLLAIQQFYNDVIVGGQEIKYDFIYAEIMYLKKNNTTSPAVFSMALWEYYTWLINFIPDKVKSKSELVLDKLKTYGFFSIPKIKEIESAKANELITECIEFGNSYTIAMFDYLDYFTFLLNNHFSSKRERDIEVSKWLGLAKDGRNIRGNLSVLSKRTKENNPRFDAHRYKKQVVNHYNSKK